MVRRSDSGQVGVETAIVMPMTVFMILGILQLSMMQQARLLTEYAAFRAVRAGAIDQVNCGKMLNAAVQGILPSLGRTDTAEDLIATYTIPSLASPRTPGGLRDPRHNISGVPGLDIVDIDWIVKQSNNAQQAPYTAQDFDDPDRSLYLVAQVTYDYELRIPFADFMIHEMWTGGNYLSGQVDQLVPTEKTTSNISDIQMQAHRMSEFSSDPNSSLRAKMVAAVVGFHRYFVPIVASYSMRMMSNLPSGVSANSQSSCTGVP
jgi:hypothetical protein